MIPPETPAVPAAGEGPELPGLRTWRAVYVLVGALFLLGVALLAALTRFMA